MFRVNFNDQVKVKLTDHGVSLLKREREELNQRIKERGGKAFDEYEPKTDEQGYTTFQIWDLMERIGPHMGLLSKPPIEGTMIFPSGELCDSIESDLNIRDINVGNITVKLTVDTSDIERELKMFVDKTSESAERIGNAMKSVAERTRES